MPRHVIVLGTSEPQDFQLYNDEVALVGTGLTLDIEFRQAGLTEAQVDALGYIAVAWLSQATGTARVTGTEGLPLGTYLYRWTLTDSGGTVGFVPNLDVGPDEWRVVRV